jgi:D-alanine-D-alanine ligase
MALSNIRVCSLFGGKSGEHEISLLSAKSIYQALDKDKYDVVLVGIDKEGNWLLSNSKEYLLNAEDPKKIQLNKSSGQKVLATSSASSTELISLESGNSLQSIDIFLPIMHGTFGEDGTMQGLLEILNVAYVGAGVLGSAVGMDKDVMKRLLQQAGISVAPSYTLKRHEIKDSILETIVSRLQYPVFVKPANLGSSVGISKAIDKESLLKAVEIAFKYDTKILIEKCIIGKEIECAVLGNNNPRASLLGEVIPTKGFYSYEAKYLDENGAILKIPAQLNKEIVNRIQEIAMRVFKVLECSGMARVDFFLTPKNEIFVNEINTIPGFTKISMYPKLWEVSGLSYSKLLDELIELGLEKFKEKNSLKRSFT